ncbi:MAG: NAD-dependent epimerase/dehydratase family protein [Bacteroidales bacterium]|nr:NAD-dependent epimerase/dehydratase family protein [Bacteroidales bacterium]
MKILITGVHGFIGSHVVECLSKHHLLYGLDIVFHRKKGLLKTCTWGDLENEEIPPVDAILHLAGKAHDTKKKTEEKTYFEINTGLTKKIVDYFSKHKEIKKFIFFSSVKAAAESVKGEVLLENVMPAPIGPYGESKRDAENYILSLMEKDEMLFVDREVIILRPCMIHGPGNKGNLNLLYQVVNKGLPWPLGAFENKRSFTSMQNLIFVMEKLFEENIPSGIYNMADDEAVSTNAIIQLIAQTSGKNNRIWYIPQKLLIFTAKVGDVIRLPLTTERLLKLTENYVVSNEKIKKTLKIQSMPLSAEEGLKITINSFKS